jgi:dsDNA-specific endonuclease/ATPase MutS2
MDYLQKYKKYKQKYIILKNKQKGGEELLKISDEYKDIIIKDITFFKDIINELNNYNKLVEVFKKDINNKNEELKKLIYTKEKLYLQKEEKEISYKVDETEQLTQEINIIQKEIIEILKYIEEKEHSINEATQMFEEELKTNNKYKRYIELKNNPLFLYIIGLNNKKIQPIITLSD